MTTRFKRMTWYVVRTRIFHVWQASTATCSGTEVEFCTPFTTQKMIYVRSNVWAGPRAQSRNCLMMPTRVTKLAVAYCFVKLYVPAGGFYGWSSCIRVPVPFLATVEMSTLDKASLVADVGKFSLGRTGIDNDVYLGAVVIPFMAHLVPGRRLWSTHLQRLSNSPFTQSLWLATLMTPTFSKCVEDSTVPTPSYYHRTPIALG